MKLGVTLFRGYQALEWTWVGDVIFCNLLANFGREIVIVLRRMDQPLDDLSFYSAVFRQILVVMRLNASTRTLLQRTCYQPYSMVVG